MPHETSDGTYRFVFYASDWEEPPHVHVQREHRVGKFWLDPVRLERSGGFDSSETLRIARILERYQAFLMESWREYFSRELGVPGVERVIVTEDALTAELSDGRTISVPLDWYPRLAHATPRERNNWELIGSGEGIHWPDLDEDISVEGLIAGRQSGEGAKSFRRWLKAKREGRPLEFSGLPGDDGEQQDR